MPLIQNTTALRELLNAANTLPDRGSGSYNPNLQDKTVTPTLEEQIVIADEDYDALHQVTVSAIPVVESATPKISVSSSGFISAVVEHQEGYILSDTKAAAQPLQTVGATTYTPSVSDQIITKGRYLTGDQVIVGDKKLISENIADGVTIFGVAGSHKGYMSPSLQNKVVSSSTTDQTVTADEGYDGLNSVVVNAIQTADQATPSISISSAGLITASSTQAEGYVASGTTTDTKQLVTKGEAIITPTTTEQTAVGTGVYTTGDIKVSAIATETKTVSPSTTSKDVTPSAGKYLTKVTVNAMPSGSLSTPTVNSYGLVTSGISTSGYVATGTTKTLQLATKGATTITPTESQQTIASGQYLTGVQTIAAIPNTYIGSGVVIQKYYTGSSVPSASLGNNGDLYLRL